MVVEDARQINGGTEPDLVGPYRPGVGFWLLLRGDGEPLEGSEQRGNNQILVLTRLFWPVVVSTVRGQGGNLQNIFSVYILKDLLSDWIFGIKRKPELH